MSESNTATPPIVDWAESSNVTARGSYSAVSGLYNMQFDIPAAQVATTHTVALSINFEHTNPPITLLTQFLYMQMPATEIDYMNVTSVSYLGGSPVLVSARNLGPSAGNSLIVRLSANNLVYQASVIQVSCGVDANLCEAGLTVCNIVFVTPQMTALPEMGSVLLQVYWSGLGISSAASTESLHVYNPSQPTIPLLPFPAEGYITESTLISIQVSNLALLGQYPEAPEALTAYSTANGSATQTTVHVEQCTLTTAEDGVKTNSVKLLMPSTSLAGYVTVTVQLQQAPSVKASTVFVYHALPKAAPKIKAYPPSGPITSRNKVLLELQSFYFAQLSSDVVVQFVEPLLSEYTWEITWLSSNVAQTAVEVFSPWIAAVDYHRVFNATTGEPKQLEVLVYPSKLSDNKQRYGATFFFQFSRLNAIITDLSPTTALVGATIQASITLENVAGITSSEHVRLFFGEAEVPSSVMTVAETLAGVLSLVFTVSSDTIGAVDIALMFADGRTNATCVDSACADGFLYTSPVGLATISHGPWPSQFTALSSPIIDLGLSNFRAVSSATHLLLLCNGDAITLTSMEYTSSGSESNFEFQLPPQPAGLMACVLEQASGTKNSANFNLTITEATISIQEVYPAEALPGELITAKITNILPTELSIVYKLLDSTA